MRQCRRYQIPYGARTEPLAVIYMQGGRPCPQIGCVDYYVFLSMCLAVMILLPSIDHVVAPQPSTAHETWEKISLSSIVGGELTHEQITLTLLNLVFVTSKHCINSCEEFVMFSGGGGVTTARFESANATCPRVNYSPTIGGRETPFQVSCSVGGMGGDSEANGRRQWTTMAVRWDT